MRLFKIIIRIFIGLNFKIYTADKFGGNFINSRNNLLNEETKNNINKT